MFAGLVRFWPVLLAIAACDGETPPSPVNLEYQIEAIYGPELDLDGRLYPITPDPFMGRLGMVRDGAGRIVLRQAMEGQVKVVSPTGELLEVIGRRGDGPGEYRQIERIGLTERGRLWIFDGTNRRVTLVPLDRSPEETLRVPPVPGDRGGSLSVYQVWDDGSMLADEGARVSIRGRAGQTASRIWSVNPEGEVEGPLDAVDLTGGVLSFGTDPSVHMAQPIRTNEVVGTLPRARRGVLVERYRPEAPDEVRIRIFSLDGSEMDEVTYRRGPIRIPETLVDSLVASVSRAALEFYPTEARTRRAVRDSLLFGEFWPGAQRIVPSLDGLLWLEVGRDASGTSIYERIGRREDGTVYAQRVHVPAGVVVNVFGADDAWGMTRDALGQDLIAKLVRIGPRPPPLGPLVP